MTMSPLDEYRTLERKSSDELLEAEGQQVLGRYENAAYHCLQAGQLREQMARFRIERHEYDEAAEDWLSALACYLKTVSIESALKVVKQLQFLRNEGLLSVARDDLYAEILRREQDLQDLQARERASSFT